jgi:hypothetical protein
MRRVTSSRAEYHRNLATQKKKKEHVPSSITTPEEPPGNYVTT